MALQQFDITTPNNDIGLYMGKTRKLTWAGADITLPEMATWLKVENGGEVIWKNTITGEVGIWVFGDLETAPIVFNKILASATIDGSAETTNVTGSIYWAASMASVAKTL